MNTWGSITGDLADQLDLFAALEDKEPLTGFPTGAVSFSDGMQLTHDAAKLHWNDATYRLAIGKDGEVADAVLDLRGAANGDGYLAYFRATNNNASVNITTAGGNVGFSAGWTLINPDSGQINLQSANDGGAIAFQMFVHSGYKLYVNTDGHLILGSTLAKPSAGTNALIRPMARPPGLAAGTAALYADSVLGAVEMCAINAAGQTQQLTGDVLQMKPIAVADLPAHQATHGPGGSDVLQLSAAARAAGPRRQRGGRGRRD